MACAQDSLDLHLDDLGELEFERALLHAGIYERLLHGHGRNSPPRVVFMAGGPAAGKSTLMTELSLVDDAIVIDVDRIREELPEYARWREECPEEAASLTHREASQLAKTAYGLALERGHHVVFDSVGGDNDGTFSSKIVAALDGGTNVRVCYATVPVDLALAREAERFAQTGRKVPDGLLRSKHAEVRRGFRNVAQLPVSLIEVYETSTTPAHLLARGPGGNGVDGLEAIDRSGYADFLDKGTDGV